ncbi:MAG: Thiamine-phosphate pyrophosphorylase, partial [uncultured bacterium]
HHLDRMPVSGAAGIHLTYKSVSIKQARRDLGPEALVGYSARSCDEALKAQDEGADYILLGSIFQSNHFHQDYPVIGLEELNKTCRRLTVPVYASGGIQPSNLIMVKDSGAAGFTALDAVYIDGEIDHNISLLNILWEEMD